LTSKKFVSNLVRDTSSSYLKLYLQLSASLLLLATLLPFIRSDYWTFRVAEFPRLQKLILGTIVLVWYGLLMSVTSWLDWSVIGLLVCMIGYLLWQVYPFTPFTPKQLIKTRIIHPDRTISMMMWNVYQYNRNANRFLELSKKVDSDIILLAETDIWWQENVKPLEERYPFRVLVPLENTYGMLLYSKLPLIDANVHYLVEEGIPSIHVRIQLRSKEEVQLFCIHPTPPVPQENPRSTERDKELLLIAELAKTSTRPVIVCGDLNDVAWSYTTNLFQKMSGLLDPRRGRGFFNTFHAKIPLLRFPLDHVFCSTDFTLIKVARLQNSGSDHFPMYIKFQYEPRAALIQEEPQPTEEEEQLAQEKLEKETREEGPSSE